MSQWQYQAHAEPVLPTPRTALPAQAEVTQPDLPLGYWGFPTALLVAASVLVTPPAAAAPMGWDQPLSQPITVQAPFIYATGAEIPYPAITAHIPLEWATELSRPVVGIVPLIIGTGADNPLTVPVVATALDWDTPISLPVPPPPPVSYETGADDILAIGPIPQAVSWSLEDVPLPHVRSAFEWLPLYPSQADAPVTVQTVTSKRIDWYQPLSLPTPGPVLTDTSTGADRELSTVQGNLSDFRRIPVEERFSWQKPITSFLAAPPGGPARADRYVVDAGASGVWTGHETEIAWFEGPLWRFDIPEDGWLIFNRGDSQLYVFDGAAWGAYAPASASSILTILTADPGAPSDDTAWIVRTGAAPTEVALRVRIGGTTYDLALLSIP